MLCGLVKPEYTEIQTNALGLVEEKPTTTLKELHEAIKKLTSLQKASANVGKGVLSENNAFSIGKIKDKKDWAKSGCFICHGPHLQRNCPRRHQESRHREATRDGENGTHGQRRSSKKKSDNWRGRRRGRGKNTNFGRSISVHEVDDVNDKAKRIRMFISISR